MKTEGEIRAMQFAISKMEIQKADGIVLIWVQRPEGKERQWFKI